MKKKNLRKTLINYFVRSGYLAMAALLWSGTASAQSAYKAPLNEIKESGYHKIMITPDIAAKSNPGLSDFRITSEEGKPVPYILKREEPVFNQKEMQVFPVISSHKQDSISELIVEAGAIDLKQEDYSFVLVIKKADALRRATISGSNDNNKWYAITDNLLLGTGSSEHNDEYLQFISLPFNKYRYLKISVSDNELPSLNITKTGVLLNRYILGKYTEIPPPAVTQKDSSDKKSYVTFTFNDAYPLSKLKFIASGAALFKRRAIAYDTSRHYLFETILTPEMDSLHLSGSKLQKLLLVVENNDDEPLKIQEAEAWQLQQYAIAHLDAGKKYHIETGNNRAVAPVYDLQHFSNKLSIVEEIITPGALVPQQVPDNNPVKTGLDKKWIWIFIIIALLLLLFLSYRLMQNIPGKQNDRS
ncbi:MAG: hypothetical protein KIT80_04145 [Chitinophagaceae bacterium]|nr:hypothetical protein [Chitinophagaceae bacterium]MCW5926080.1 hypothetical protein [Chitinophagaceae bacterium]